MQKSSAADWANGPGSLSKGWRGIPASSSYPRCRVSFRSRMNPPGGSSSTMAFGWPPNRRHIFLSASWPSLSLLIPLSFPRALPPLVAASFHRPVTLARRCRDLYAQPRGPKNANTLDIITFIKSDGPGRRPSTRAPRPRNLPIQALWSEWRRGWSRSSGPRLNPDEEERVQTRPASSRLPGPSENSLEPDDRASTAHFPGGEGRGASLNAVSRALVLSVRFIGAGDDARRKCSLMVLG